MRLRTTHSYAFPTEAIQEARQLEAIRQALGRDDEQLFAITLDARGPDGLVTTPFRDAQREDKIVALGLWDNGAYTALVTENSLYSLYYAFAAVADPMRLQSIRVSLAEVEHVEFPGRLTEQRYVSTSDDPLFGTKFSYEEGDSWRIPVKDLDLSLRARNALKFGGVTTLGELVHMTDKELIRIRGFGITSLFEVKELLEKTNMSLRGGLYKDPVPSH